MCELYFKFGLKVANQTKIHFSNRKWYTKNNIKKLKNLPITMIFYKYIFHLKEKLSKINYLYINHLTLCLIGILNFKKFGWHILKHAHAKLSIFILEEVIRIGRNHYEVVVQVY